MTGRGLYGVIQRLGEQEGLTVRPHGIRHTAITQVLDITKGDLRAASRFSRHRDIRTLMLYDDARTDAAGDLAKKLAEEIGGKHV